MLRHSSPLKQSPQLTVVRGITRSTGEKGAKLDKDGRGGLMSILRSLPTPDATRTSYTSLFVRGTSVYSSLEDVFQWIRANTLVVACGRRAGQRLYAAFSAIIVILQYRGRASKSANHYYNCCTVCPALWKFGLNIRHNALWSHLRRRCMRFQTDLIL